MKIKEDLMIGFERQVSRLSGRGQQHPFRRFDLVDAGWLGCLSAEPV
jgi:hypothetical protein